MKPAKRSARLEWVAGLHVGDEVAITENNALVAIGRLDNLIQPHNGAVDLVVVAGDRRHVIPAERGWLRWKGHAEWVTLRIEPVTDLHRRTLADRAARAEALSAIRSAPWHYLSDGAIHEVAAIVRRERGRASMDACAVAGNVQTEAKDAQK